MEEDRRSSSLPTDIPGVVDMSPLEQAELATPSFTAVAEDDSAFTSRVDKRALDSNACVVPRRGWSTMPHPCATRGPGHTTLQTSTGSDYRTQQEYIGLTGTSVWGSEMLPMLCGHVPTRDSLLH